MNSLRCLAAAAALTLAASAAPAQPGPPGGAGPGASAPRGAVGAGRMGGRWDSHNTPGWSLMTPQERQEHQTRMRSMTSHEECKAYAEQHHQAMAARAKDKGLATPAQPRRDPCAGLKR